MSELSAQVKEMREAAGVSQFEAAVLAGVGLGVVQRIEQGIGTPLYSNVVKLTDALEKAASERAAETSAA